MDHLAEVHITESLERHADEIQMRASMLQSHLESAAAAMVHVKSMSQQKVSPSSDAAEDNDEAGNLLRKADDLISQIRSAKVVSSKAIRHLEELKSRHLTLNETTLPAIEQTQASTSAISLSVRTIGYSITQLLNEEGRTTPFTYSEISAAISSNTAPFSSLANQITATTAQLQTFHNMISSLTQTVEISSPPPPPPWQVLAQRLRDVAATSITQQEDLIQMKNEAQERNAALAMRDTILEEMTVKVEVLEKRVGESGGRREQVRELEAALQAARTKEKDLSSRLSELRKDLRSIEGERERWKKAPITATVATTDTGQAAAATIPPSATNLAQIQLLKLQIATLESAIRHLRRQAHAHDIDSSIAFLNQPLIPSRDPSQSLLQTEACDVLREMLHFVTQPENQLVRLNVPKRDERLKWRSAKETAAWQTSRMTEEWEGLREWRNDLSRRVTHRTKPGLRKKVEKDPKDSLAKLQVKLPHMKGFVKPWNKEVRILGPREWEDIEGIVGIEGT